MAHAPQISVVSRIRGYGPRWDGGVASNNGDVFVLEPIDDISPDTALHGLRFSNQSEYRLDYCDWKALDLGGGELGSRG